MMEQHEQLLLEWAARVEQKSDFVKDGIINPEKWHQSHRKVLFLLKEAYQSGNAPNGYDLRHSIREDWKGPRYKMWHTVARWSYAAQGGYVFPVPQSDATSALLSSAVVNIKKSNGKKQSNMHEIRSIAERDGELLQRQISMIDPRLVICGNTWSEVRHLWPDAKQVFPRIWQNGAITFIDFWHPANRYPNDLNDFALTFLVREAIAHKT